jgi:hypothetical protein
LRWACERQTQQTITQLLGSSLRPITRTQMQHVCVAVDCQLPCVCVFGGGGGEQGAIAMQDSYIARGCMPLPIVAGVTSTGCSSTLGESGIVLPEELP